MAHKLPIHPAHPERAVTTAHEAHDDVQGMLTGVTLAALGITLFNEAGILAGGTVGLALLLNYASGLDLSLAILLVNAPFYGLGLRMGREFTPCWAAALYSWIRPVSPCPSSAPRH